MTITGVVPRSATMVQSLVDMRTHLDDLQRQLGTGKRAETYAGIGLDRGLAVGLRAQVSAITGYQNTISTAGVPMEVAQTALGRISEIAHSVKSSTQFAPYDLDDAGQTTGQQNARAQLDELLSLLNAQVGDRYIFSGRAVDRTATESLAHILDGDAGRAGLKQVIAERNAADAGTTPFGRLAIPVPGGNITSIAEDGTPFGLKLAAVNSNLSNAVVTGPGGAPPSISVDFTGGDPNPGETITFTITLPDGSTTDLSFTATASATPKAGEFTIGGAPNATATNLRTALAGAVTTLADIPLKVASTLAAANDFFNMDAANPPRRVDGPPFDTAIAFKAGTPADTVFWYTGEAGSDPARSTAVARIDASLSVSYGMRANEQALRNAVQNIAVFASATFSASDPNAQAQYRTLADKLSANLAGGPGQQNISDISADIANAQATLGTAKARHDQTGAVLTSMLSHIEDVPLEEVSANILALNTRLQVSLQTTAILFQTTLVNYL